MSWIQPPKYLTINPWETDSIKFHIYHSLNNDNQYLQLKSWNTGSVRFQRLHTANTNLQIPLTQQLGTQTIKEFRDLPSWIHSPKSLHSKLKCIHSKIQRCHTGTHTHHHLRLKIWDTDRSFMVYLHSFAHLICPLVKHKCQPYSQLKPLPFCFLGLEYPLSSMKPSLAYKLPSIFWMPVAPLL